MRDLHSSPTRRSSDLAPSLISKRRTRMDKEQKASVRLQLSPVLALFREAVLRDRALQERLRNADSCQADASVANDHLRAYLRLELSSDLEKTPLRDLA